MSVLPQSRYMQGTLTRLPNSSGNYNLTVLRTVPPISANFSLYIWQEGDRPDLVAFKELKNAGLWWAIFDINPEIIYPLSVPPGAVIRIPSGPVMGQGTILQ